MLKSVRTLAVLAALLVFPSAVFAQAALTGIVKDASGGVLPGVTVEASSPVLIEKIRSVVTDSNGAYRIIDLRPGPYTVTFSLPGFNNLKRDGVELSGTGTFVVDADLRVGAVEETVTVTGEAPTVDVQTATKGRVISNEVIETVPTGRSFVTLGVLIPSVNSSLTDVGGSGGDIMGSLSAHGSRANDQRILMNGNPINDLQTASAGQTGEVPNIGAFQEIAIDYGGVSAEQNSGGVYINLIPKDGGNNFSGSTFATYSTENLASTNFTDRLKGLGLTATSRLKTVWEVNPTIGGPIKRDKVWFFGSGRLEDAQNYVAGMFYNKNAFDPNAWSYVPDTSRPALAEIAQSDGRIRITWQADQKNKFAYSVSNNVYCRCPQSISSTLAPEASSDRRMVNQMQMNLEWKAPLTNRLLGEAQGFFKNQRWGFMPLRPNSSIWNGLFPSGSLDATAAQQATYSSLVPVQEQASVNGAQAGLIYRGPGVTNNTIPSSFHNTWQPTYIWRAAVSYVSGGHNVKVGMQDSFGSLQVTLYSNSVPYRYRFNNGVPNQIALNATPITYKTIQDHDLGFFGQDRWTINRMTISYGGRFDYYHSHYPEQTLGPGPLVPNRNFTFASEENLDWKDVSWRTGWAYDLRGNQKTAVRAFANKYISGQAIGGIGSNTNPIARLVNTTTRSWTDGNSNYIPECDLTNPLANGECGIDANTAFGTQSVSQVTDTELRKGRGVRGYNYEFSVGMQHEVLPRVSLDFGYYRRIYGNLSTTDNLAVSASDYDAFPFTVPSDSRLPQGGGYQVTLYDLKPAAFGRPAQNSTVLAKRYGEQREHWDGFDLAIQARLSGGVFFSGGTSTGKTMTDQCEVVGEIPEALLGATILPKEFCRTETPFLTQLKGLGAYTVPRVDVQVAATFQSIPGQPLAANYVLTTAEAARTLGRPLSGNTANVTVNVIAPGAVIGERLNQVDLRVGKILKFGPRRATVNLDVYNLTNSDTVIGTNSNYATLWRPTSVLQPRFLKFSVQLNY